MVTDAVLYTAASVDALFAHVERVALPSGLNVEYVIHGSNDAPEKVVLIMGLMSEKEAWAPLLSTFLEPKSATASRYQFLTFDNRGVGGTDKPAEYYSTSIMADDVLQLMKFVGWDKAHVVGISMGGMIAQEVASRGPSRVASLALLVTTPGSIQGALPHTPQLCGYWELTKVLFGSDDSIDTFLYTMYPDAFLDSAVRGDESGMTYRNLLTEYHQARLRHSRVTAAGKHGQYAACLTHNLRPSRLAAIQQAGFPILVVGAGEDRLLHFNNSNILHDNLKGERTTKIIYETSGHNVIVQEREAVAAALDHHFQSCHQAP
ncbi:serine protease family S33 [Achlya hypogyna]|uniref:Serine protease family S33 n=1 Tax=Achlya hypogyna TaxID=1202772 RepID=A0A1V9YP75_ACHHY|nr:serine protease family S33 [Achlya hypogyna]